MKRYKIKLKRENGVILIDDVGDVPNDIADNLLNYDKIDKILDVVLSRNFDGKFSVIFNYDKDIIDILAVNKLLN